MWFISLRETRMIKQLWHNTSNDSTIIMQYILTSWQEELVVVVVVDYKHILVGAPSMGTYVGTWHISTIGLESVLHQFALLFFSVALHNFLYNHDRAALP